MEALHVRTVSTIQAHGNVPSGWPPSKTYARRANLVSLAQPSSADVSCTITNEAAVCTDFATSESGKPYSDTITDYTDYSVPVTVTAGAELLNGGGSGGSGGSGTAAKTTKLTGTVQPTGTDTTISPSSTTGGLPRITQNAVLAGVAAVIGGAAML